MDKLQEVINNIRPIDAEIMDDAQRRLDNLTKPPGSLGYLESLAKQLAAIQGTARPRIREKAVVIMAADHGVTAEGVSAYPSEVTGQMVQNFLAGGAGINVLARHVGAKIILVDMGIAADIDPNQDILNMKIGYGSRNMAQESPMTYEQAKLSVVKGIQVVEDEIKNSCIDILGTGDMGIGNTTASSAIIAAFTGLPVEAVTGHGTGIDDATLQRKIDVIERAFEMHKPDIHDPIDVLAKLGGFEIGGIAGCILASANLGLPIVIDGLISSAGALLAYKLQPLVAHYVFFGHQSVEIGQTAVLRLFDKRPILDLGMRLGEGTGAALAINIIEAGMKILNQMATFDEAGVSEALDADAIVD